MQVKAKKVKLYHTKKTIEIHTNNGITKDIPSLNKTVKNLEYEINDDINYSHYRRNRFKNINKKGSC